jgi:hypothetical protein
MANFLDAPTVPKDLRDHRLAMAEAVAAPPESELPSREDALAMRAEIDRLQTELTELRTAHATLTDEHERLLLAYNKEPEKSDPETSETEPPANAGKSGKRHR